MKNIRKKQEGITLIALVITIIVLLIFAGIAISMISGNNGVLIKATDAEKANEQGVEEDRMRLAIQSALIDGEGTIDLTKHTGNNAPVGLEKALKDEFGEGANSPYTTYVEGKVTLSSGKKFNVTTSGSVKEAITFAKTSSGTLAVGSEVTASNGEKFYVIGGDGTVGTLPASYENVILLAKYNLKKENGSITLKQDIDVDTSTGDVFLVYSNAYAFCSSTAWNGANVAVGDNLNNKTTINSESTSAVGKAKAYGESLGATGRLMLKSEADSLNVSATSSILSGQYEAGKNMSYWLGTVGAESSVWAILTGHSGIYSQFDSTDYCGVRPVVEVSASSIE